MHFQIHRLLFARLPFNHELNEFCIATTIHFFALALMAVFLPIFLLQLNYSIPEIFYYNILAVFIFLILSPFAAKLAGQIGLRKSILISKPFMIVSLIMLYFLQTQPALFYPSAVLLGVFWAFFWVPYHLDFTKLSDAKKEGKEIGFFGVLQNLATFIAPLLGAIVIYSFGFSALFLAASILLLISVIPLYFADEKIEKTEIDLSNVFSGKNLKHLIGFMGHGFTGIGAGTVWVLFIFAILGNYALLGAVSSISFLVSALIILLIGIVLDHNNHHKILKIGTLFNTLIWIVKSFANTIGSVFAFSILANISDNAAKLPANAITYDHARQLNPAEQVVVREIGIQTGDIIFMLIFLFLLQQNYVNGLIVAGLGNLLMWLI